MNESESQRLLNSLLKQNVEQIQSWLKQVSMGQQQVPKDFNWHGFAEVAASEATSFSVSPLNKQLSLTWANIAIFIYEFLIEEENENKTKESFLHSIMALRACMIASFGARKKDFILDPSLIIDWFFDRLKISREDAISQGLKWKDILDKPKLEESDIKRLTVSEKEILELRLIKTRLNTIKFLVDSHQLSPGEELKKWLSIREKLL